MALPEEGEPVTFRPEDLLVNHKPDPVFEFRLLRHILMQLIHFEAVPPEFIDHEIEEAPVVCEALVPEVDTKRETSLTHFATGRQSVNSVMTAAVRILSLVTVPQEPLHLFEILELCGSEFARTLHG